MKKILLLIAIVIATFVGGIKEVQAEEQFYEAEYIQDIWFSKKNNYELKYQKARFMRRSSDDKFAYCLEPFLVLNTSSQYTQTIDPTTLSIETWDKITKLAYYGYGYPGHSSNKWYVITQMLIWKEVDPYSDFYYTDSLNGNRIEPFNNEIAELENLVENHNKKPSFDHLTYVVVKDSTLKITDKNNVLNSFTLLSKSKSSTDVVKENNVLEITPKEKGKLIIMLQKENNTFTVPPIFYYHPTSQNMLTAGYLPSLTTDVIIDTIETNLNITKIDYDTKTTDSQGEAKLEGAIYQIFDQKMNEIDTITIGKDKQAHLKNLEFGTYYIKEQKPGIGYTNNDKLYSFEITEKNPNVELTLDNKVIENKIEINKKYGTTTENELHPEEGVTFEIYNKNNEIIKEITTDYQGYATITLPYGTYLIKQKNSKEGYQKVDDFYVKVDKKIDKPISFDLIDLEIPVPDTGYLSMLKRLPIKNKW